VKEISSYGETIDSKDGQGYLLLDILTKYTEAFNSILDGKSEDMSTTELVGGVRIHYIFQSIFVKCLEEVDPCDDLTDEDIRQLFKMLLAQKMLCLFPRFL
jgi:dynamin 1-like protein